MTSIIIFDPATGVPSSSMDLSDESNEHDRYWLEAFPGIAVLAKQVGLVYVARPLMEIGLGLGRGL